MLVLDTPAGITAWSREQHRSDRRVALVPTMGALHAGHRALIEVAGRHADDIVVSIFVNPLQFDRRDDFDRYPRPLDDDVVECHDAGVAAVYAPTAATMYPDGFQTHVEPGPLADVLEGAARPGHFRGVTTVVAKLFGAVQPDVAVFGEKDFQQLVVIRRMVADLDMGITVAGAPTVREADGVALSSRNVRLDPRDRAAAVCVPRALAAAVEAGGRGERRAAALEAAAAAVLDAEPRARCEYVAVFDPVTLAPIKRLDRPARIATAVWFGDVRLIDNRELIP